MEELGLAPLGFVATDQATLIWGLEPLTDPAPLFDLTTLEEDLDGWLSTNALMKRTFRGVATIAGLIQRNLQGQRKTGRQATFSSDILYDTLQRHDPDHLMLSITRQEALSGLIDFARLRHMVTRSEGRITHLTLERITPLAAPLLLEVGKVRIDGEARERLLMEETTKLMQEAGLAEI